jgi:ribosomal protein S27E
MNSFLPTPSLVDFREVRCPKCHRLLLKVRGIAEISIVCHRCGSLVIWPALDLAIVVQEAQTSKVLAREEFSTSAT